MGSGKEDPVRQTCYNLSRAGPELSTTGTRSTSTSRRRSTLCHTRGSYSDNFLKRIENFLLGRHQVVCISRGKSDPAMVENGVPQGSVLGPILFLIYVDDAARELDWEVSMFADDTKIWSVIRGPADEDRLQMNLNRLEEWSNRWLLRFDVKKWGILRLDNITRSASTRDYFLGAAALKEFEAQKDLAVLMTISLKSPAHCSRMSKSAISVLSVDRKVEIDDQVKASLLFDFFQSVFTREPSSIFAHPSIRQPTSPPSTLSPPTLLNRGTTLFIYHS
nr:unnamed protein product [Spirometra erinaceieuropaei]